MSRTPSRTRAASGDREEPDVAEIKKALATGNVKDTGPVGSAILPILCYCTASILMTVVNKFVVSGHQFNMTFLLLCIQSLVCTICVATVKRIGIISFRDYNIQDAKAWFPISFMLVSVIYTGSKSLASINFFLAII